jgi:hypothetical protein
MTITREQAADACERATEHEKRLMWITPTESAALRAAAAYLRQAERMREALEYYARYDIYENGFDGDISAVQADEGACARAALAEDPAP